MPCVSEQLLELQGGEPGISHDAAQVDPGEVGLFTLGAAAAAVLPAVIPTVTSGLTLTVGQEVLLGVVGVHVGFGTGTPSDAVINQTFFPSTPDLTVLGPANGGK